MLLHVSCVLAKELHLNSAKIIADGQQACAFGTCTQGKPSLQIYKWNLAKRVKFWILQQQTWGAFPFPFPFMCTDPVTWTANHSDFSQRWAVANSTCSVSQRAAPWIFNKHPKTPDDWPLTRCVFSCHTELIIFRKHSSTYNLKHTTYRCRVAIIKKSY